MCIRDRVSTQSTGGCDRRMEADPPVKLEPELPEPGVPPVPLSTETVEWYLCENTKLIEQINGLGLQDPYRRRLEEQLQQNLVFLCTLHHDIVDHVCKHGNR
eukprot:TRINITY_DN28064_c0_g1_i2.p3 TRINITY_DN28064_c0_g1~~TRINITY_DN28064_c0_g1_i2.p3  ORF type:complete len:102 (+),score=24.46 TRINITY_DN28064_c0_g1_i2:167-472(+)